MKDRMSSSTEKMDLQLKAENSSDEKLPLKIVQQHEITKDLKNPKTCEGYLRFDFNCIVF
jgi:hypothetical protein